MIILNSNEYKNINLVKEFFTEEEIAKKNGKKKYFLTKNNFAIKITLCHSLERTPENSEIEVPAISWSPVDDPTILLEKRDIEITNVKGDFDNLKETWVKINNGERKILFSKNKKYIDIYLI